MCYSAQVWADYRKYVRLHKADIGIEAFHRLFVQRAADPRVKIPKGMEAPFLDPQGEAEQAIQQLIHQHHAAQATRLEQELFAQRKRLADAERTLASKLTRTATESRRIATDKIDRALARLADLRRTEPRDSDARIFPGTYAPVMVWEQGRRVIKPMRYQCRPAGKPAHCDTRYPGTYNARRDNLQGFWKGQFGHSHGLVALDAFYENVTQTGPDGQPRNVVLAFRPRSGQVMLVACLWSHWRGPGGEELLSFAAITDEPPPEVAAAGHDRCVVPIQPAHIDAWLQPDPRNLAAQQAILDDRERPYYEHQLAA